MRARVAGILEVTVAAIALSVALTTGAWALRCMEGECGGGGGGGDPCQPCNPASSCYAPCSDPSLSCYASAGCGGSACNVCVASSSCYEPCTLSCFDTATCGAGPTDPSPLNCHVFVDGDPEEGAMDLGFASIVAQTAPAEVESGSYILCVDMPAAGTTRTVFAGRDDAAETSQGVSSAVALKMNLPSATLTGPSLSDKDRAKVANCVQHEVNAAMTGSPNSISVTTSCPTAQSHEHFSRVVVGKPSSNLATAMGDNDGLSSRLPNCMPKTNGVSLVNSDRARNVRALCETIVHEFFHTLGLVHVENRPAGSTQDIMQNPRAAGDQYTSTDTTNTTKKDPPPCTDEQNTRKKVQQSVALLVQPRCGDGRCDPFGGEECSGCSSDCGPCGGGGGGGGSEPSCGDHTCNGNETCDWCPDCGTCGDGGPNGGGGPGGGAGPMPVCCEAGFSNCLYIPCGAGWRCINNGCFPGCVSDQDCQYLCSGANGGLCICAAGQCQRTQSCVCDCDGPFCCPPNDPHCVNVGGGGGGGGDPVWRWCFDSVCNGDWQCANDCWYFFAD